MNTVHGLGRRLLAIAALFFCLASAFSQDKTHAGSSASPAANAPAAQSCILLEDVPREAERKSSLAKGYPLLWPQHLTGLDLAVSFTLAQKDSAPVRLAIEDYYDRVLGKAASLPQHRYNPNLNESGDKKGNHDFEDHVALLLAKPPFGTSATGFLDFISHRGSVDLKETHQPPAIYIADDLDTARYRYAASFGKAPFTISQEPYSSSPEDEVVAKDILFFEEMTWGGHPGYGAASKALKAHLFVPDDSYPVRGETGKAELGTFSESGAGGYFVAAAVSNALALAPDLSHAALREWLQLTANRENRAFAATGIPALNAYRFIRTVARLRDACRGKEFEACEAAIRADEKKREAVADFRDEALEKFNGAMLTLKNATIGCDEKVAAMKVLRQATLLDPSNRKYRAALADFYLAEKHPLAADFIRFGKDMEPLLEQTERWAMLRIENQAWERRALRRSGLNISEALNKALNSTNPEAQEGAVIASAALPDKAAVDFLHEVARRKNWGALSRGLSSIIHADTREKVKPKAKLPHYVPLLKAAIAELHQRKEPSNDLIFLYSSVATLIKEADFDLEKVRHLIDYLAEESVTGRPTETEFAARDLANLGYYDRTKFENQYVVRTWLHVLRKSNDVTVIGKMAEELGKYVERRQALLTILDERKAVVTGLPELVERLRNDGWAK